MWGTPIGLGGRGVRSRWGAPSPGRPVHFLPIYKGAYFPGSAFIYRGEKLGSRARKAPKTPSQHIPLALPRSCPILPTRYTFYRGPQNTLAKRNFPASLFFYIAVRKTPARCPPFSARFTVPLARQCLLSAVLLMPCCEAVLLSANSNLRTITATGISPVACVEPGAVSRAGVVLGVGLRVAFMVMVTSAVLSANIIGLMCCARLR